MKTLLTKIFTATASAAVAVAGLSGLAQFSQTVRADFYTPRLIVTGSEISKDRVNAGDEFDLTVHFINESEDTHLYNINIKLLFRIRCNINIRKLHASESVYIHFDKTQLTLRLK